MKKFFLYSLLILASFALTATAAAAFVYNSQTLDASKLEARANSSLVYDARGELITGYTDFKAVALEALPQYVKWAFICTEDKDFYTHNGISYGRIAKAAVKNLRAGRAAEGASTISQQLIKNTHLTHDKTIIRKIREASLAHKLEKSYSKDEILEMYLNVVYFGNNLYGLGAAAHFYFNKNAVDLTLREAAGLAGILQNPSRYDPVTRLQSFSERADFVINLMREQGKITAEQLEAEKSKPLVIVGRQSASDTTAYRNAAVRQAAALAGQDISGCKIFTFFDAETQKIIDGTLAHEDYKIKNLSGNFADVCVISADSGGRIKGLHTNNQSLLAGRRNFASALKPLAVYAPAVELNVVTPSTVIKDEPYTAGGFHPQNHDGKFRGDVTVRESLAKSYNIPAVKILEYTRVDRAAGIARGLGLPLGDENLSLALGNTNDGTAFTELLGGYCALANGGSKTSPSFVKRIETAGGKTVWQYTEPHLRVLDEETCRSVTDMLKDVVSQGTARKLNSLNFDIAAKTGTSERENTRTNTDAININYTPSDVLLVWHGNADMKPQNDLAYGVSGGGITSFIARDIAAAIGGGGKFTPPRQHFPFGVDEITAQSSLAGIILDGHIGGTGAPEIRFSCRKDLTYEIYKRTDSDILLIEVIKNHGGEYIFTDKNAVTGKIIEYWVTSGEIKSNSVKIFTAQQINKHAAPQKHSKGKHWFF